MLRLTFSPADLGRVRFAVSAVAQIVRSSCTGECPRRDPFLKQWQRRVVTRAPGSLSTLLPLVNADEHYYPDLLTPDTFVPGAPWRLDDELDGLVSASESAVVADFGTLARRDLSARLVDVLGSANSPARRRLAGAVRDYHDLLFGGEWRAIRAHLEADVTRRAMLMATHGVEHALATLHPRLTWESPVLTLHGCRAKDFDLAGRGLLLVPSAFGHHSVAWVLNHWQQPALVYPAADLHRLWAGSAADPSPSLDALVGRARATALRAIGTGCGTGDLARHLGVSPSTASEHATTLRRAGLVVTERTGRSVRHRLTRLGVDLLGEHTG
ncbi:DUF5937 family protein [Umezawaea sp. Da 62-37]|uniref:ArsR/SmtB family transcription factor n=1 Tax=Umezawaea sp. Da 62-37 TaxID=3075927 RepID=UPI0028F6E146|nr:DUF5937 family protein [Umezawaea sp. Da 62-37]WNV84396.1 DUF5937 family protein [Umezawaea sp. Da 62-37]